MLEIHIGGIEVFNVIKAKDVSLKGGEQSSTTAEGVRHLIKLAGLVTDDKTELLNLRNPAGMHSINLGLPLLKWKRFVICMQNKLTMYKVVAPMPQGLNQCEELQCVDRPLPSNFIPFFAKECHGFPVLRKDCAHAQTGGVAFNLKEFLKIRQCEDGSCDQFVLQLVEALFFLRGPTKLAPLEAFRQRRSYGAEVADKSPVEGGETVKTAKLMDIARGWPFSDCSNLCFISMDTLRTYNLPKKNKTVSEEVTLLSINIESMSS